MLLERLEGPNEEEGRRGGGAMDPEAKVPDALDVIGAGGAIALALRDEELEP